MTEKLILPYHNMGLLEFQNRFPDNRDCYEYLKMIRFPTQFACSCCGATDSCWVATRGLWQCNQCRKQVSLTSGTMFHRTRTPLRYWFWAIFLVSKDKRGHSALQLSKELNIPYDRSWLIMHKIRAAMAHRDHEYTLQDSVEIDEAYFGSPDVGQRGRGTQRPKALVAVSLTAERKPKYVKMKMIKRLDARCVKSFAQSNICKGSTVYTDGLHAYSCLSKMGYVHIPTVSPGKTDDDVLHWVHIIISNTKAFITGTFHGLDEKHLQQYLDEFCYRFNRRQYEQELFDHLLSACAEAPPLTYAELTR